VNIKQVEQFTRGLAKAILKKNFRKACKAIGLNSGDYDSKAHLMSEIVDLKTSEEEFYTCASFNDYYEQKKVVDKKSKQLLILTIKYNDFLNSNKHITSLGASYL